MAEDKAVADAGLPRTLGHYQALQEIGRGGMAVVYKGVQPSLNRTVAIKVLPERFARTPEMFQRFDREANVVAQLNHPNIVQVIDRGREGDTLFIVMEYVEGDSLDKLIQQRISIAQALDFALQICDALEYAHAKGVVHRDLKPSNILVDRQSGRAKIADFGIAQFETDTGGLSTLTGDHAALGTMNYMSPEQRLDSHRVTYHTDIFAFGVMLYEMLTSKLPIGHFKLPSLLNHDVPVGFDAIVKKCLEESAADRYQSAAEIRADLGRITGRHLRLSRAPSGGARFQWSRRRVVLTVGIAAAVIGGGVVGALFLRRPPATQSPAPAATTQPAAPAPVEDVSLKMDFARAQALIGSGDRQQAITILREIVQRHGSNPIAVEAQYAIAIACEDLQEYDRALLEHDLLVKFYPSSPRASESRLAKCRIEWKTASKHGMFTKKYDAAQQRRLVKELRDIADAGGAAAVPALELAAEIAQEPELNDWRAAAESLALLYDKKAQGGPDPLLKVAELYDKNVGDKGKAIEAYERFLRDYPNDARAGAVRGRLTSLRK